MESTLRTKDAVLETVKDLLPIIKEHRDNGERERRVSDAVVNAMKEAGLFKLWIPRELGGDEIDLPALLEVVEEISATDAAAGWVLANVVGNNIQSAFLPLKGAQEVYGSDPAAPNAGAFAPRGRAIPVEGGYRLTGRWPLVSGCHHAKWLGMGALVFDGDAPRMGQHGAPDLKIMLLPSTECEVLDTWYSAGMRGTGSTDVAVNDAFVPEHRVFSALEGEPRVSGALYRPWYISLI